MRYVAFEDAPHLFNRASQDHDCGWQCVARIGGSGISRRKLKALRKRVFYEVAACASKGNAAGRKRRRLRSPLLQKIDKTEHLLDYFHMRRVTFKYGWLRLVFVLLIVCLTIDLLGDFLENHTVRA